MTTREVTYLVQVSPKGVLPNLAELRRMFDEVGVSRSFPAVNGSFFNEQDKYPYSRSPRYPEWLTHSSCMGDVRRISGERVFQVCEFDLPMEGEDLYELLAYEAYRKGCRFADFWEGLDFAQQHPDVQRKRWIAILGNFAFTLDRGFAVLDGDAASRGIQSYNFVAFCTYRLTYRQEPRPKTKKFTVLLVEL